MAKRQRWRAPLSDEKFGSTFASLDIQRAWLAYLCNIRSSYAWGAVTMQRHSRLFRSWNGSIINNESSHANPDFAHEDNESRRPDKPKWGDGDISLVLNCVSRQYSWLPFGTCARYKLTRVLQRPIRRWNLRTWPPIRISDIPSWTYDKNTYFENPTRSEGPWIKKDTDSTISNKFSGWICWYNEINS